MRILPLLLAVLLAGFPVTAMAQVVSSEVVSDSFPHLDHSGLFPLCTGCHAGIPEGALEESYPEPDSCDGCHDGVEQVRVDWSPDPKPLGLVDFSHPQHATAVAEDPGSEASLDCAACHLAPGGERLEVVPLRAESCLDCHEAQEPADHFSEGTDCRSCHRAVAESETGSDLLQRVAAAPDQLLPDDHASDAFLADHAPSATESATRCASCHVQERCVSCHVDIDRPAIRGMPAAPLGWALPSMPAEYPTPASHLEDGYDVDHGRPAPATTDCSTCHTRNDCLGCHIRPAPPVIDSLVPRPARTAEGEMTTGLSGHPQTTVPDIPGRHRPYSLAALDRARGAVDTLEVRSVHAPGVGLAGRVPTSHESPFFMTAHPLLSGGSPDTCANCHQQSFCTGCHEQPGETGFHPEGFVLRHAPAASSAFQDCSSCHSTEQFCRQCHIEMGQGSTGRLGPGYHDAEPLFLLRHATAARRDLEACASCHTQNDCRQCHAQTGAFGVSPHGPDFDPARAQEANPWICAACHIGPIGDPIGGGAR